MRIVAEPMRTGSVVDDPSCHLAADHHLASRRVPSRCTHKPRATIGCVPHAFQQQSIVRSIELTSIEIDATTPSLAAHARLAAECVDHEAGVVGEHLCTAASREKVAGLGQGVLLEALE